MSSLLNEYRHRHQADFIWASNDGVCFFNVGKKPVLACVISDPVRSTHICEKCNTKNSSMVCDILSTRDGRINNLLHEHILPDIDLFKKVRSVSPRAVPFVARHQRDMEVWLWNFYLHGSKQLSSFRDFNSFVKSQNRVGKLARGVEQMLWVCTTYPEIYHRFYNNVYQRLLVGRNYLMTK